MQRHLPFLALGLAALLATSCSRTSKPEALPPSTLVVTFGYAPAAAFAAPTNGPSLTPALDSLATSDGMVRSVVRAAAPDAVQAAAVLGPKDVLDAVAGNGVDVAAFLADPALAVYRPASPGIVFVAGAESNATAVATTRLSPYPFEHARHEGFLRGDAVTSRALAWLSDKAGIPREEVSARKAPGKETAKAQGLLRKPFHLWVHLADPVFRDSAEHMRVRVKGAAKPSRMDAEVAFLDLQVGRLIGFLSDHGLRDQVQIRVLGLHGDALSAEDASAEIPGDNLLSVIRIVPETDQEPDVPTAPAALDAATARLNGLAYRLRVPDAKDETLLADCEAYRDAHPESAQAWCWLGCAQHLAKKPAEALASQQKAFDLEPKSAFRMSNLGLAALETADVAKAIDQLENAYLAEPSNPLYKTNLAAVLLRVGMSFTAQEQYADAAACLSRVILLQPRNPYGHLAQGRLHEKTGQRQLAEASYRKALEINPKFKPAQAALKALAAPPAPAANP